nr:MAG TPA: hypothetical protein [Caudoviricetes sp.]
MESFADQVDTHGGLVRIRTSALWTFRDLLEVLRVKV